MGCWPSASFQDVRILTKIFFFYMFINLQSGALFPGGSQRKDGKKYT